MEDERKKIIDHGRRWSTPGGGMNGEVGRCLPGAREPGGAAGAVAPQLLWRGAVPLQAFTIV